MRDLGGIHAKSGKMIARNRFVRSNLPEGLSGQDLSFLLERDLNTVIDLRTAEEISMRPSSLSDGRFSYHHVRLAGSGGPKSEDRIAPGYIDFTARTAAIGKILTIMANAPGGVIFNCHAGKDRAGVVAMLLLLIAGAREEDIISDYELSYGFIRDEIDQMHRNNPDLPDWMGQSKKEYMEETLQLFARSYGDIDGYLDFLGLEAAVVESIRGKMLGV